MFSPIIFHPLIATLLLTDFHKDDQAILYIPCCLEKLSLGQLHCLLCFTLFSVKEGKHGPFIHAQVRDLRQQFLCLVVFLHLDVITYQHIQGAASDSPIGFFVSGNSFK